MNKKKKKEILVIVLVIAGLLLFIQPGGIKETSTNIQKVINRITGGGGLFSEKTYSGVEDKGVSFKVFGVRDGKIVGELQKGKPELFATVEFTPPGIPLQNINGIIVQHTITASELNDIQVDINDIFGSYVSDIGMIGDSRYENSLISNTHSFSLLAGQNFTEQSEIINILDLTEDCNNPPYCTFKLQLDASFPDIDPDTGQQIITYIPPEDSYGTFVIKVTADVCADETPFGQCSLTTKGKFCDGVNGLLDCANPTGCTSINYGAQGCDCEVGYIETDGDAICTALGCLIGIIKPGECTGIDAQVCALSCAIEGGNCPTLQNCRLCGRAGQEMGLPLSLPFDTILNAAECPLAYNGDPADSCHETLNTCKYKGRKGSVTVTLAGG